MTKEERELKKDILICLNKLQEYVNSMVIGHSISANSKSGMLEFGNEVAIVTNKCKKADIYLNIRGDGK